MMLINELYLLRYSKNIRQYLYSIYTSNESIIKTMYKSIFTNTYIEIFAISCDFYILCRSFMSEAWRSI